MLVAHIGSSVSNLSLLSGITNVPRNTLERENQRENRMNFFQFTYEKLQLFKKSLKELESLNNDALQCRRVYLAHSKHLLSKMQTGLTDLFQCLIIVIIIDFRF